MNKFAKEWVKRLRDPSLVQVREKLGEVLNEKGDKGFCCLGVACDIIDPKGWQKNKEERVIKYNECPNKLTYRGMHGALHPMIQERLGMHDPLGWFPLEPDEAAELNIILPHDGGVTLANLNDSEGYTFSQIADVIEKYQDRIFKKEKARTR